MNAPKAEDLEGVLGFFSSSWGAKENSGTKYRVYLAQKGLNLNEYAFKRALGENKYNKDRICSIRKNTFLAPTGLLLKAEEIAESYLETGHFPEIQIFDELCKTGYDFSSLVYALERIIYDYLTEHCEELKRNSFVYHQIRRRFIDAIKLYAYKRDAGQSLLEIDLEKQIFSREAVFSDRWLPFILSASRLITETNLVENTAFIPTFKVKKNAHNLWIESLKKNGWQQVKLSDNSEDCYHYYDESENRKIGSCQLLQKSFTRSDSDIYLHCTLRNYDYDHDKESAFVTIFPLWVSIPVCQSPGALDGLADLLDYLITKENDQKSKLGNILRQRHPNLIPAKMQLLSTLVSMTLFLQINDAACDLSDNTFSDLEKVSQNYGFIEEIYHEFERLCSLSEQERTRLWEKLNEILILAESFPIPSEDAGQSDGSIEPYIERATEFFISRENIHSADLKKSRELNINYARWTDFSCYADIKDYLDYLYLDLSSFDYKMAALILIMSEGYVGQRFYKKNQSLNYLNAGETCVELLCKPMQDYLPALIELERVCRKWGYDVVETAERFGNFIEEEYAIKGLSEKFAGFIQRVYSLDFLLRYLKEEKVEEESDERAHKKNKNWATFYKECFCNFLYKSNM